jgi:lysophospholipase L1-like esterase
MPKKIKTILALSLSANLLILLIMAVFIYRRGGLSYILTKLPTIVGLKSPIRNYSAFYLQRKDLFNFLPNHKASIIFLGDSITAQCEWSEFFHNSIIKNRGLAGDRTDGILARLNQIVKMRPHKIFIMIGINDLLAGVSATDTLANYREILKQIKQESPETKIFVQSVLPINKLSRTYLTYFSPLTNTDIAEFNSRLKSTAEEFGLEYIDLYSLLIKDGKLMTSYRFDGLHLKGEAYVIWKEAIERYVN